MYLAGKTTRVMKFVVQLFLAVVAIVWATASVFANDEQDCFQGHETQVRIRSCSDIIRRSPDVAAAYHNRAFAYEMAGDLDNAIADYSRVIALEPSNASAYANRGRALATKGDYSHALEDAITARDLIEKATADPGWHQDQ